MSKTRQMSKDHKEALAEGRRQGRAVRAYLDALERNKPKRGRKRTPESIQARLEKIDASMADADPVKKLQMVQERIDLEAELSSLAETTDMDQLEKDFVEAAAAYSERKGISYSAWREIGVPASVLKEAGVPRTRSV